MKLKNLASLSCLIVLSACASAPKPEVKLASTETAEIADQREEPVLKKSNRDHHRFRTIRDVKEFDI